MIHLELTQEEAVEIKKILERDLARLEVEVIHTDDSGFHNFLKERKAFKEKMVARIKSMIAP